MALKVEGAERARAVEESDASVRFVDPRVEVDHAEPDVVLQLPARAREQRVALDTTAVSRLLLHALAGA